MRVYLLMGLLLLAACSEQLTLEEKDYKDFCKETDGAWMNMLEMKDGKPIGPSCYGCMPDESNHLCSKEEYEAML